MSMISCPAACVTSRELHDRRAVKIWVDVKAEGDRRAALRRKGTRRIKTEYTEDTKDVICGTKLCS